MEGMKYNFMGNKKADENVPEQDLSSTVESNFDDIEVETAESDSQDNFSSAGNSTYARQGNHNGTIINDQNSHNGPIISDLDGLYTYGQLAKMLNKPENNLRYLINTFRDYIHPIAVTSKAGAKRANFKYSEQDYITLKSIISCRDRGITNAEIINLLKDGLLPENQEHDEEDELIDIIAKRILALYKKNLSARDEEVINQFTLVAGRNQSAIDNLIQQVNNVFLEQKKYYESELTESKKQTDMLMEQNKDLQKQLSNTTSALSDAKDAYERNNQFISDAQEVIQRQAEYIDKLKDDLSHSEERSEEKKGFFSKLFGL